MKKDKLIIFLGLIFINLPGKSQNSDASLVFWNKFKNKDLPIAITQNSARDFAEFIWEGNLRKKNIYPEIEIAELPYLSERKEAIPSYLRRRYVALYQITVNHPFRLVLYKKETNPFDDEEHPDDGKEWMILATFDKSGKLIDKFILGGFVVHKTDQYGWIDKNFNITTQKFDFLPSNDYKYTNAIETKMKYVLKNDGHFVKLDSISKKGKFKTIKDKEGYYPYPN